MLFWRKFGAVLRGSSTPFQILSASVLGAMLAFTPGVVRAPGLMLVLLLVLVQLNANLVIAAAVGVLAYLLSLLLMPLTFHVGIMLLEGPLQPLFRGLINGPITAWFGLDYYVTTGGLVMGPLVGLTAGVLIVKLVQGFRSQMARLEEGSERYRKYMAKRWVRIIAWAVVGGTQNKQTFAQIAGRKIGNPIRPLGAVFVTLLLVLMGLAYALGSNTIVHAMVVRGLEHFNGATVDLQAAEISLASGDLVLAGLAMADPDDLDHDIVRADRLEARMSRGDLLRRRATIDLLLAEKVTLGEPRAVRGYLVTDAPGLPAEPPPPPVRKPEGQGQELEALLEDAKLWKERLEKIQRWLERASRADEKVVIPEGAGPHERIWAEAALNGYANVRAEGLITRTPSILVRELQALGVRTQDEARTLDVHARNWSTQPPLVEQPPEVRVTSSDGLFDVTIVMSTLQDPKTGNNVSLAIRGLDARAFAGQLSPDAGQWIVEGTIDLTGTGQFTTQGGTAVELPMAIQMKQVKLMIPQMGPADAGEMNMAMRVYGPLSDVHVEVDAQSMQREIQRVAMEAGRQQLLAPAGTAAAGQKQALIEALGKELEAQGGDAEAAEDLVGRLLGARKPPQK